MLVCALFLIDIALIKHNRKSVLIKDEMHNDFNNEYNIEEG